MSGRIIPLREDPHERTLSLLPWFVTDRLEPGERAEVEAHLNACAACRAEERLERRLEAQVAALPFEAEAGWARMRGLMQATPRRRAPWAWAARIRDRIGSAARPNPGWVGWALAGQVAAITLLWLVWPKAPIAPGPAAYHALAAAQPTAGGNALVMFDPGLAERELRSDLVAVEGRVVDGPTAAGAYVLYLPRADRTARLAILRARPGVTMAEPIDPPGAAR